MIQPLDQGVLEVIKCCYKHDLLLRLLNEDAVGSMNIAKLSKTLNIKNPVVMSAISWNEMETVTIVKSWRKLLKSPDAPDKDSDGAADGLDVNSLLNDMDIPFEERTDWLTAGEGDPGYHEFSGDEIVSIAREEIAEEEEDE